MRGNKAADGCRTDREYGVNYIDLYTPDSGIRAAVGEALKGRRDQFYLQSHVCSVWKNGQYMRTRCIEEVKAGMNEMLELFQTDYIDVGMIHYVDSMEDWEQIVGGPVLEYVLELKKSGVVRHIGMSSHNPEVALAAVKSGYIEVLMFSVNPCYDLQPAGEDVEELWNGKNYEQPLINMDSERQELYETCQRLGVQCLHYALTRPGVASVMAGAHSVEQLKASVAYEDASEEEKDYALAFASFPNISWKGHCMYCSHCAPCPKQIDVASVTKFLNLAKAQKEMPETVQNHYELLAHHGGECISCGACESRCPFEVPVMENMRQAKELFGK